MCLQFPYYKVLRKSLLFADPIHLSLRFHYFILLEQSKVQLILIILTDYALEIFCHFNKVYSSVSIMQRILTTTILTIYR